MSSSLPEPRPLTRDDAEAAEDVACALEAAVGYRPTTSEAALLDWWSFAELETGSWAFEADGRLLGFGWIFDRGGTPDGSGFVHPEAFGRGVGSSLADRYERWAQQRGFDVLHTVVYAGDERGTMLVRSRGYREARRFYELLIDLDGEPPPAPESPEGLRVVPVAREDARAFYDAITEAFEDDWGFVAMPFEEYVERQFEGVDTSYYFVARDGDEVVGAIRCDASQPELGYVHAIGVRPAWRRRGLGRALLQHAFGEFHRRGVLTVGLSVDTQNATGATRLYEGVGMRVGREDVVWEKQLG
jgi:mycothiol synthase